MARPTDDRRSTPPLPEQRSGRSGRIATAWLILAWLPVSLVLAFIAGEGLVSALGYPVGGSNPAWVSIVTDAVTCAIAVLPCVLAAVVAWRDHRAQVDGALRPFVVAITLGLALVVITLVSLIGDLTR